MSSLENEALATRRREEILRAARFCFGKKGFSATKMKDIAARLQMSVGNLYNYFKSKDEIVRTLAQRQIDKLVKNPRNRLRRPGAKHPGLGGNCAYAPEFAKCRVCFGCDECGHKQSDLGSHSALLRQSLS